VAIPKQRQPITSKPEKPEAKKLNHKAIQTQILKKNKARQ
jgi:hypothetical protein